MPSTGLVPKNAAAAARTSPVIGGVAEVVAALRAGGLEIGSTTGYTLAIEAEILPGAAAQVFAPDALVCMGDTAAGRPPPLMVYRVLLDLDVWPAWSAVKVDDAEVGTAESLNAGCWTVGVAVTGNVFGLSAEDTAALSPGNDFARHRAAAATRLTAAGAHYVVDGVADLLPVVAAIEGRLAPGATRRARRSWTIPSTPPMSPPMRPTPMPRRRNGRRATTRSFRRASRWRATSTRSAQPPATRPRPY